ncbi:MAG: hypothetical protein ACLFRK_01845 [Candidatus Nanohaloarchaea archaeon]
MSLEEQGVSGLEEVLDAAIRREENPYHDFIRLLSDMGADEVDEARGEEGLGPEGVLILEEPFAKKQGVGVRDFQRSNRRKSAVESSDRYDVEGLYREEGCNGLTELGRILSDLNDETDDSEFEPFAGSSSIYKSKMEWKDFEELYHDLIR